MGRRPESIAMINDGLCTATTTNAIGDFTDSAQVNEEVVSIERLVAHPEGLQ